MMKDDPSDSMMQRLLAGATGADRDRVIVRPALRSHLRAAQVLLQFEKASVTLSPAYGAHASGDFGRAWVDPSDHTKKFPAEFVGNWCSFWGYTTPYQHRENGTGNVSTFALYTIDSAGNIVNQLLEDYDNAGGGGARWLEGVGGIVDQGCGLYATLDLDGSSDLTKATVALASPCSLLFWGSF